MATQSRPSRAALKEWLEQPGRTQAKLAKALDVTQQTVSALLKNRQPSEELAQLIEAATGIPWGGWFTEREMKRREKRLERAAALGARLSAAAP